MAINLLQGRPVHEADLVRRDPHNRTVLAMEVQNILVPLARGVLPGSPELCYAGEKGTWDFAQGVQIGIVYRVGDDCDCYQK